MTHDQLYSARLEARFAALESRLAALEKRAGGDAGGGGHRPAMRVEGEPGAIDAIGAPLSAGCWPMLREAVKATISEIGVEEAARRYGAAPERFRSVVYRRGAPGLGTRARLATVVRSRFQSHAHQPLALADRRVLALPYYSERD